MLRSRIPDEISQRLKTLSSDIITILLNPEYNAFQQPNIDQLQAVISNFPKNLHEITHYYFNQGGKLLRPTVSLLMSDACNESTFNMRPNKQLDLDVLNLNQYRIAMIAEMIHTASLVHDDVIDKADTRRGKPTVNARWGNRQAVLAGDFILARATKVLCTIGNPTVISTMASIVEDLVKGELMQLSVPTDGDAENRFQHYMLKSFYKTASLFANSCKSVALLSCCPDEVQKRAFDFGLNLGLAFQLTDDLLDYVSDSEELGKPTANDLKLGLATAPTLFAAQEHPELNSLINRKFSQDGDAEQAYKIVIGSSALDKTRGLIQKHCQIAADLADSLNSGGPASKLLVDLALSQIDRRK